MRACSVTKLIDLQLQGFGISVCVFWIRNTIRKVTMQLFAAAQQLASHMKYDGVHYPSRRALASIWQPPGAERSAPGRGKPPGPLARANLPLPIISRRALSQQLRVRLGEHPLLATPNDFGRPDAAVLGVAAMMNFARNTAMAGTGAGTSAWACSARGANDQEGRLMLVCLRISLVLTTLLLTTHAQAVDRIMVVATFSVIGDMLANVGGDHIITKTIVGSDGDCELYQPTPADVATIASARAVFLNGLNDEFEPWLEPLLKQAEFKGAKVVVTRGVRTLTAEEEHPISGRQLPAAIDQHAWLDPRNGIVYVRNTAGYGIGPALDRLGRIRIF